MKKLLFSIVLLVVTLPAAADEGMWMLPYLQKMNIRTMKQRGCKLSAGDIYSLERSSLKDAVVIFGGGCTGEIVSPEGLLFTNHHCGYGAIRELSSVEHDYLKNGFWAMSQAEELPVPGLEVRFVRGIRDVTAEVLGNVPATAGQQEFDRITGENIEALSARLAAEHPGMEVEIESFFEDNRYFAFVLETYRDVRLVGAPPSSIGKFGGDTDNWMWPRHTGDFSVFRVYAGADNRPSGYSPENSPYRAERFLKISLDGYDEGDFAMIMGFPGSTQRFATSYEIDDMLRVSNPQRIFIRGERQAILWEDMMASDRVRIQYASKYAGSSNYWKNSIGMSRGIERLGVKARKEAQEAAFQQWAESGTLPEEGFVDALPTVRAAMEAYSAPAAALQYLSEAFLRAVELFTPAMSFLTATDVRDSIADPAAAKARMSEWYGDYNAPTDRKVAKRMMRIARENMRELPSFYAEIVDRDFGGDTDAFVDDLYDRSLFADEAKVLALIEDYDPAKVEADPAVPVVRSVLNLFSELYDARREALSELRAGRRKYVAGLLRQYPDRSWAPDANFTIRLTYGRVLPYDPSDGIRYSHYTTLKGVIEKENPENPAEFTVPERLKELYAARDYGRYADRRGELRTCFLADCDITGGNSGSPVMNGRGELIGLAFDGNWEAMSGDVAFEPELQRTIAVDIRYVLFIIDKFAGAGWLLDEMTFAGARQTGR